jgi:hypothetical protein
VPKAADESQALLHMQRQYKAGGGVLSGSNPAWVREKVNVLHMMDDLSEDGIQAVVDVGIGDMVHWRRWGRLAEIDYLGLEGVQDIVDRQRKLFPGVEIVQKSFSEVVKLKSTATDDGKGQAVVALDVLYHIPDDDLHDRLVEWVFSRRVEWVLLSYATDPSQTYDGGQKPGDAGFCWFPRPAPTPPEGWEVIHRSAKAGTPQKQELALYVRSS